MKFILKPLLLLAVLGLFILSSCSPNNEEQTIYLFRHAEKVLDFDGDNPPLTTNGIYQSMQIADILKDRNIELVYSTDYRRNKMTIEPLVDSTGVTLTSYEWDKWEEVIDAINSGEEKTIAICGHGDILLPMIEKLGGKRPQAEIGKHEYKTIYQVNRKGDEVSVKTMKF